MKDFVIFKDDIFDISGRIIFCKEQKVNIDKIIKTKGFYSKLTGQYIEEKIQSIRLVGYPFEFNLKTFKNLFINNQKIDI